MNGGKLFFSVDDVFVNREKLKSQQSTFAVYKPNNFEDQLFTYGVRINPDILLDIQSALIPVKTSLVGEPLKFSPVPWYYEPLLSPNPKHPITKNINLIKSSYINSIDFVGRNDLKKNVLLTTSIKTKQTKVPCKIDLSIAMVSPEELKFNSGKKPVAVLLEGNFPSVFKDRKKYSSKKNFKSKSIDTKIIVVADDDFWQNKVKGVGENMEFQELGYDSYTNHKFGNKDFIMNAVEYLCDNHSWILLRSREVKLRFLSKSKIYAHRYFWQVVNTTIPLFFMLIFYTVIQLCRKLRYAKFFKKI